MTVGFPVLRAARWALVVLFLAARVAFADTHLWTDQDGRRYEAELVGVYKDQVTFRHTDGRTFTLSVEDLAAPDQLLVRQWLAAQPPGAENLPPPTQSLSPFGRGFILDEPHVVRLRPMLNKGYPSAYLGVPLTIRDNHSGPLRFVNVYFFDDAHQPVSFSLPPPDSPIMVKQDDTTAFVNPADIKPGQTYLVLFPVKDPAVRIAPYAVVTAGNDLETVATVFPQGSWRDFTFPERANIARDKYADYSGQELYAGQAPGDLFELTDVFRLEPKDGSHAPDRDYFRLQVRPKQPFPAAALSGAWYAFDKNHQLLHSEDQTPWNHPSGKDIFYYLQINGHGAAELGDVVPPLTGEARDLLHLPGATWWDKPEVDSLVFVFGTETKKVARVFSKSGAKLADLPVPEKAALGGAMPATEAQIPVRPY